MKRMNGGSREWNLPSFKHDNPGRPKKWEAKLKAFLIEMYDYQYSKPHIYAMNREIRKAFLFFGEKDPVHVTKQNVLDFLNQWKLGKNRRHKKTLLNSYLQYCGNHVIQEIKERSQYDIRMNVRWLRNDQVVDIYQADLTPREEITIRLALDMALRREEIRRVRLEDIDREKGFLHVRGKGNKLRTVPFSPDLLQILDRWLLERERILFEMDEDDPGTLLITVYRGEVRQPGLDWMDNCYKTTSEKVGFHFSYHDLRRTWARTAWEIGVPVETIGLILGHRDNKTTLTYIGANVDHALDAMQKLHFFKIQQIEKDDNNKVGVQSNPRKFEVKK